MIPLSLFCDACGAANPQQAPNCFACCQPLSSPSLSLSVKDPGNPPALAPLPSIGALLPGSVLAQRYRIVDQIGQGGFGMVYKAQDLLQKHKLVAVKQLNLYALNVREIIDVTDTYNREVTILSTVSFFYNKHELSATRSATQS